MELVNSFLFSSSTERGVGVDGDDGVCVPFLFCFFNSMNCMKRK